MSSLKLYFKALSNGQSHSFKASNNNYHQSHEVPWLLIQGFWFQPENCPQWKFTDKRVFLIDDMLGKLISIAHYERADCLKVEPQLALKTPLGWGFQIDPFKKLVWDMAGPKPVPIHPIATVDDWIWFWGWVPTPGGRILVALILNIGLLVGVEQPWKSLIFLALTANLVFWITTEVPATISFSTFIFWISCGCGLNLINKNRKYL